MFTKDTTCSTLIFHIHIFIDFYVQINQEKEHFLKVKERLPNPDIVIGFTKWDLSANERKADSVSIYKV